MYRSLSLRTGPGVTLPLCWTQTSGVCPSFVFVSFGVSGSGRILVSPYLLFSTTEITCHWTTKWSFYTGSLIRPETGQSNRGQEGNPSLPSILPQSFSDTTTHVSSVTPQSDHGRKQTKTRVGSPTGIQRPLPTTLMTTGYANTRSVEPLVYGSPTLNIDWCGWSPSYIVGPFR